MKYITSSYEETQKLAFEFASNLKPGMIVTLDGDLGAGKTAFTTGVVAGLGCSDTVTSPTFTIANEYRKGSIPVFHFDIYRLSSMEDLYDIGWEDYLSQNGIIIIEWADIIKPELDCPFVEITIKKQLETSDDTREITIEYRG